MRRVIIVAVCSMFLLSSCNSEKTNSRNVESQNEEVIQSNYDEELMSNFSIDGTWLHTDEKGSLSYLYFKDSIAAYLSTLNEIDTTSSFTERHILSNEILISKIENSNFLNISFSHDNQNVNLQVDVVSPTSVNIDGHRIITGAFEKVSDIVDDFSLGADEINRFSAISNLVQKSIGRNDSVDLIDFSNNILNIKIYIGQNPLPLTYDELTISLTSSITDSILNDDGLDISWDTVILDYGKHGKIECNKVDAKTNSYGGKYFESAKFIIKK